MRQTSSALIGFFLITLLLVPEEVFCAEQDQTFLLNESQIFGSAILDETDPDSEGRHVEFPALSTSLPWAGVGEENLDIPKEILDHLFQSDLSDQEGQDQNTLGEHHPHPSGMEMVRE